MARLSVRSTLIPAMILDRESFTTGGSFEGRVLDYSLSVWDMGRLSGADQQVFRDQHKAITYVVWSYATPIAWWSETHGWHVVTEKFSPTTSKHQSQLWMVSKHLRTTALDAAKSGMVKM